MKVFLLCLVAFPILGTQDTNKILKLSIFITRSLPSRLGLSVIFHQDIFIDTPIKADTDNPREVNNLTVVRLGLRAVNTPLRALSSRLSRMYSGCYFFKADNVFYYFIHVVMINEPNPNLYYQLVNERKTERLFNIISLEYNIF